MRTCLILLSVIVFLLLACVIHAASPPAEPLAKRISSLECSPGPLVTEAAATQPAEKSGLPVVIKPAKASFGPDEPLSFSVTLRNESDEDFTLLHDPWSSDGWKLTIDGAKPNESFRVIRTKARVEEETKGKPLVLKAHEEHSFQWTFGDSFGYLLEGRQGPMIHLPSGTYTSDGLHNDGRSDEERGGHQPAATVGGRSRLRVCSVRCWCQVNCCKRCGRESRVMSLSFISFINARLALRPSLMCVVSGDAG